MAASIFLASLSMCALGYCSSFGGESNSANYLVDVYKSDVDDSREKSYEALAGGYGFASFMLFVGFAVFLGGAIYISPMLCGSNSEKKMISKPQEIDSGYVSYTESSAPPMGGSVRNPALSTNSSVSDQA